VRGPRDFSRGIRTQFSRTEGSGAPLRRVAVSSSGSLCCPEIFSGTFRFSFRSVFRLKREPPFCSFGGSGSFLPGPSELERDALRPAVDRAVGGAVEGGAIWSIAFDQASSFDHFRSFFQSYPQVVDNFGRRVGRPGALHEERHRRFSPRKPRETPANSRSRRARALALLAAEGGRVVDEPHP
jgi:hypothetical protein